MAFSLLPFFRRRLSFFWGGRTLKYFVSGAHIPKYFGRVRVYILEGNFETLKSLDRRNSEMAFSDFSLAISWLWSTGKLIQAVYNGN
jgi:hypothetical protein